MRIGLLTRALDPGLTTHPDCVAAATETARLLEALGHAVEESHPRALEEPELFHHNSVIVLASTARDLDGWGERLGHPIGKGDVEPFTWVLAQGGRDVPATRYIEAVTGVHAITRRIADWWGEGGFDLLLTPTLGEPPPRLGHFAADPRNPVAAALRAPSFSTFTFRFNCTGQPAISLPLHWNAEGLPIGVQLVAAYGREDLLLRVAAQLEEARPWGDRLPPIHASRPS